jgi:hypothetical protein
MLSQQQLGALAESSDDDSAPVSQLRIQPSNPFDRFSITQDLLSISHLDDTITVSVKMCKDTPLIEVSIYLRSHNQEAQDTLVHCQNKISLIAKGYDAKIVDVA